ELLGHLYLILFENKWNSPVKTILLTTIAWALIAVACYPQDIDIQLRDIEYKEKLRAADERLAAQKRQAEHVKAMTAGRNLLDADSRCGDPKFAGTLAGKRSTAYQVGDWG